MIDWSSPANSLLLNPRLPPVSRARFEAAWREQVEGSFQAQIGIATSGSSGDPLGRLIVIGQNAILASAAAVNRHFASDQRDIWLKTLPSFHVGGLGIYARAYLSGAAVVESRLTKWDATTLRAELDETRATLLSLVPTQLYDLLALHLSPPPDLRAVVIGGGRLETGLRERARALGWPIFASYGCTECSSQVATARLAGDNELPLLDHVQARIEPSGRLALKSEALLTGRVLFSASDAEFRDPKVEGWFITEDHAQIENGRLRVLGRAADFVKVAGEGVVMSRLEDRLVSLRADYAKEGHDIDAFVLAAADDRLGATVVLLTTDARADELVRRFNEGVLPFERIRAVYEVLAIPRSPLGKLIRAEALALVGLKAVAHV